MIRIDMDIPMPETCSQCPMCYDYRNCRAKDIYFGKEDDWICETRPNWCPLQDISPVKPIKRGNAWECGKCNQILGIVGDDRRDSYCRSCGAKADWNDKKPMVMSWLSGLADKDWREFHSDSEVSEIAKAALELIEEQQQRIEKLEIDTDILVKDINTNNCNTCIRECGARPKPGEVVRTNCWMWTDH